MPICRRCNEHKTRPCSLVLMHRPAPACPPVACHVVLRAVPLRSPSATTRQSALFPRGPSGANGGSRDRKGARAAGIVSAMYVCTFVRCAGVQSDTGRVLSAILIPSFTFSSAAQCPGRHSIMRLSNQIELPDKFPSWLSQPCIYHGERRASNTADFTAIFSRKTRAQSIRVDSIVVSFMLTNFIFRAAAEHRLRDDSTHPYPTACYYCYYCHCSSRTRDRDRDCVASIVSTMLTINHCEFSRIRSTWVRSFAVSSSGLIIINPADADIASRDGALRNSHRVTFSVKHESPTPAWGSG